MKHTSQILTTCLFVITALSLSGVLSAQEPKKTTPDPWKRQVFFGEQHLHTANSPDAFAMGTRNTVDIKNASFTNDIGDTQLGVVWQDPDFNPTLRAVYYVRVIEIPTPRWTTYDAKKLGVAPPKDVPATIQERAWSSPIWYTPPVKKETK
jgi:hypothetical protein